MVAACKDANVEAVTLRELRHHFASILIFDESYTEATVTELMGHTDINFTKKQYATWLQSAKRDKTISAKLTASRRAS
jgi:integrase